MKDDVRFIAVAYVQPDLARMSDLRTLTDLSLHIALTEEVDLTVQGRWHHDTRPPGGGPPSPSSGLPVPLSVA